MSEGLVLTVDTVVSRRRDSIARQVGDDMVVLTPENYTLHVFNEVGARIWEVCSQPMSVGDLTNTLAQEYDVDTEELEADVLEFIGELAHKGILDLTTN
jgi:hypothetical protein